MVNKKKSFSVLLTCSNWQDRNTIECLKKNSDGIDVKVYCANMKEEELPLQYCDGGFVVPAIDDENYFPALLKICKDNGIEILMPTCSADLYQMSLHQDEFAKEGVIISVATTATLDVANDKIALHNSFGHLMPRQVVTNSLDELDAFLHEVNCNVCCKVADACGGRGFALVDDAKVLDVSLFHRFGEKHYITTSQLRSIVANPDNNVIVQERIVGKDYSVSILADKGEVTHICGYVGYVMEFGAMFYAEVLENPMAYQIAKDIAKALKIDGNACFDFILKDDGSVVLLEINPRLNGSLSIVEAAGCNMYYLRCKQLLGYDISNEQTEIAVGTKMKKHFYAAFF